MGKLKAWWLDLLSQLYPEPESFEDVGMFEIADALIEPITESDDDPVDLDN